MEVYYEDIVSIEHNQEYRNLPISYDDLKNTLVLEDVPTLRFSLTSGENHEISFVNQKYYDEIIRQLNEEKDISADAKSKFIKENVKIVTDGADAAIKVLRQYLREHKGLID